MKSHAKCPTKQLTF